MGKHQGDFTIKPWAVPCKFVGRVEAQNPTFTNDKVDSTINFTYQDLRIPPLIRGVRGVKWCDISVFLVFLTP